ncbi:hypothetical protein GCM10022286_32400 [Gryllotalpicola daejeonensis]|uniref:Mandelate racemase/muconate lactonizing enzyme N-terminal domain-containing protein n=1 Tax=Gryllotalpicola daejeonensis TaxID=993087 RepID=A0ABP7ZP68_9MICO
MESTPARDAPRSIRISAVEVLVVRGAAPQPPAGDRQRQVRAESFYDSRRPAYRSPAPAWTGGEMTSHYLRIGTDAGAEGFYGPIEAEIAWLIARKIAPELVGEDALAGNVHWDLLERLERHGRHGHYKMALSAIDNALWDLRGTVFEAPVWQLLGGCARERIPAYLSTLGSSLELDEVRAVASSARAEGFAGQKWFFGDGPSARACPSRRASTSMTGRSCFPTSPTACSRSRSAIRNGAAASPSCCASVRSPRSSACR